MKLDQWNDQSGAKRSKHSITVESLQMLDTKGGHGEASDSGYSQNTGGQPQMHTGPNGKNIPVSTSREPDYSGHEIPDIDINDDEIPF